MKIKKYGYQYHYLPIQENTEGYCYFYSPHPKSFGLDFIGYL